MPTNRNAEWADGHDYEAADIFVQGGCGGDVVSPVTGVVVQVRTVDTYDRAVDNPATRGGKSVAIVGADGVRYYMSHFARIAEGVTVGTAVSAGQRLGTVGTTGRSGACHIHFGISPACPDREWSVRRGVIPPIPYLDAWKRGEQPSPVAAVREFLRSNPQACARAAADVNANDS